jgi:MFS family permease
VFYGWVIVAITFLTQFAVMGTVFYSFGVLMKPLAAEVGGDSRLGVSLAVPLMFAVVGLVSPFVGREVDRRPIRWLMLAGAGLLAVGFLGLSRATSLWEFYLAFGVALALAMALLGGLPNTALVANWFIRRRGTALGISQVGVSISGMVMAYVTSWLVGAYGWRGTSVVFALAPVAVLAPLIALLVIDRPEDRGLGPDGDALSTSAASAPVAGGADSDWTAARALREPSLWMIALVIGLCFASNGAVILGIYPHATDIGYSDAQAAAVLSVMAGAAALGKPIFGWLADHAPRRGATWLSISLQFGGLVMIMYAPSHLALVIASALFGLGYGGVMPLWGVLVGAIYGRRVFGRIMGLMGPLLIPFEVLGIPFAAWVFDRTGSYDSAFATFLGLYALAALLLVFLRLPEVDADLAEAHADVSDDSISASVSRTAR